MKYYIKINTKYMTALYFLNSKNVYNNLSHVSSVGFLPPPTEEVPMFTHD